tara:strand:- start:5285 stop:5932 length:648 start_codon:yes stop_codon:yes gene_type:complete
MNRPNDLQVGDIYSTKYYGELEILEYLVFQSIKVRFLTTGYVTYARGDHIRRGAVKDLMLPIVMGVGYLGENPKGASKHPAYKSWVGMLRRCYEEPRQERNMCYIGVTVCGEWQNFSNYLLWFEDNYVKGCQLDKDKIIKWNKVYRPEACSFMTSEENTVEARALTWNFISPEGEKVEVYNLAAFCRDNNLNKVRMRKIHVDRKGKHKSWRVENV